jgi:hypothetical protein
VNKYVLYTDPGHAWLEVPLRELKTLGIAKDISSYSYVKDGLVYLEEDCDLAVFAEAKDKIKEEFDWRVVHTDHDAACRGYQRFDAASV